MQYDRRLAGETALAFEYFELYRDMPDRTLRKLSLIPGARQDPTFENHRALVNQFPLAQNE